MATLAATNGPRPPLAALGVSSVLSDHAKTATMSTGGPVAQRQPASRDLREHVAHEEGGERQAHVSVVEAMRSLHGHDGKAEVAAIRVADDVGQAAECEDDEAAALLAGAGRLPDLAAL